MFCHSRYDEGFRRRKVNDLLSLRPQLGRLYLDRQLSPGFASSQPPRRPPSSTTQAPSSRPELVATDTYMAIPGPKSFQAHHPTPAGTNPDPTFSGGSGVGSNLLRSSKSKGEGTRNTPPATPLTIAIAPLSAPSGTR